MGIDIDQFMRTHDGMVYGALKKAGIKKEQADYEDFAQVGRIYLFQFLEEKNAEGITDIEQLKCPAFIRLVWRLKKYRVREYRRNEREQLACTRFKEEIRTEVDEEMLLEDKLQLKDYWEKLIQKLTKSEQELFYELAILELSIAQIAKKHCVSSFYIYKKRQKLREKLCLLDKKFLIVGQKKGSDGVINSERVI